MHSDSEIPPGSNRRATNAVFAGCMGIDALRLGLLGICFWRKVREERIWAEYMGEKGGWCRRSVFHTCSVMIPADAKVEFALGAPISKNHEVG